MHIEKYHVDVQSKGIYRVPVVVKLVFNYPKKLGAYCASNGRLFKNLKDNLYDTEAEAISECNKIISSFIIK